MWEWISKSISLNNLGLGGLKQNLLIPQQLLCKPEIKKTFQELVKFKKINKIINQILT
jgi:hypothetical protein